MERAKFYSRTDLSNGMHLIRAERVLDNYQEVKNLTFHKLSMIDPSFFGDDSAVSVPRVAV